MTKGRGRPTHDVTEIKAWKTSDGKIHENKSEADEHEKFLRYQRRVASFAHRHCFGDMSAEDFVNIMVEHREEAQALFAGMKFWVPSA